MGRLGLRLTASIAVLAIALIAPAGASAARRLAWVTVSIDSVSTSDCYDVDIRYTITWMNARPADVIWPSDLLVVDPGHTTLAGNTIDFGKHDKRKWGSTFQTYTRESGYFDHQIYGANYQVAVFGINEDGSRSLPIALSNSVAMPNCVPLSPTTGSDAGGTTVTIYGGATFGGDPFTGSTLVDFGSSQLSPTSVSADGRSLTFVTPAGTAGDCVSVSVENPGIPFSLPDYCYSGSPGG
jgi:hypothetical protein